ncbi:MAG: hypothetical protein C0401_11660 [Anaerolinea sp.]|nr:hypothetical protein [Anaerolinea sp.]
MMKMSKVLMIVQSHYFSDPRVRREAEALAEAGYHVDVIGLRRNGEPFEQCLNGVCSFGIALGREHGSIMRYLYEYGVFSVCAAMLALRLHLKNRYTLIQVHNLPDTLVFAALFPKLMGCRVVFDAHEAMPESFRIKYRWQENSLGDHLVSMLETVCMALANHVLTIHEPMRQLFINKRRVRQGKISVVMNWPDDKIFRFSGEGPVSMNGKFTMIYAGTIAERYGLQTAIRALPLLIPEIPNLQLRILGKGDYTTALQQLAKELDVEDYVSFETPIPLINIPDAYRSSDIGISPHADPTFGSIYFSTKVAEYLAVGLPAIVARTPIMAHYYDDSQVVFFEPNDYHGFANCVLELHHDQEYRKNLIENGLELSKKCNWSNEKRMYLSAMEHLTL